MNDRLDIASRLFTSLVVANELTLTNENMEKWMKRCLEQADILIQMEFDSRPAPRKPPPLPPIRR